MSRNHPELWLQFAEGLGVSRQQVQKSEKREETSNLIETFRAVCREGSTAEGLGALYAYESQIPVVCESKIDGLKKHYAITDPEHYRYFSVHIEADTEHAAAERDMLGVSLDHPQTRAVFTNQSNAFSMRCGKCCPAFAVVTRSRVQHRTL